MAVDSGQHRYGRSTSSRRAGCGAICAVSRIAWSRRARRFAPASAAADARRRLVLDRTADRTGRVVSDAGHRSVRPADVALALRSHGRTGVCAWRVTSIRQASHSFSTRARMGSPACWRKRLNPLRSGGWLDPPRSMSIGTEPRIDQAARWFFDGDSPHEAHPPARALRLSRGRLAQAIQARVRVRGARATPHPLAQAGLARASADSPPAIASALTSTVVIVIIASMAPSRVAQRTARRPSGSGAPRSALARRHARPQPRQQPHLAGAVGDQVEGVDRAALTDAIDTADALLEAHRIPRQLED